MIRTGCPESPWLMSIEERNTCHFWQTKVAMTVIGCSGNRLTSFGYRTCLWPPVPADIPRKCLDSAAIFSGSIRFTVL